MNFLLPDVFSSMTTFESWFDLDDITGSAEESSEAQQQRSQVLAFYSDRRCYLERNKASLWSQRSVNHSCNFLHL
jgi:hypothetical protein